MQSQSRSPICFIGLFLTTLLALLPQDGLAREDEIISLTGIGNYVFAQTFEIYRHLSLPPGQHEITWTDGGLISGSSQADSFTPLYWKLGVTDVILDSAAQGNYPEIVDNDFSIKLGLNWQISSSFRLDFDIDIDTIAQESYIRGALLLKLEQTFHLGRRPHEEVNHPPKKPADAFEAAPEAAAFYEDEWAKKMKELRKEDIPTSNEDLIGGYPLIKIGIKLGAAQHDVAPKTFRNLTLAALTTDSILQQTWLGAELSFLPKSTTIIRLGAHLFFYNQAVDSFLPNLELATAQRLPLAAETSWNASTNQVLSFPDYSFDQVFERRTSYRTKYKIVLNESFYDSVTQASPVFALAFSYSTKLSRDWTLEITPFASLGSDGTFNASAVFQFSYAL